MIPYLCNTPEEEMKKDFYKLPIVEQEYIKGINSVFDVIDCLEEDLKDDMRFTDDLLIDKIKTEIKMEYLKEVRERMQSNLEAEFVYFVDKYYASQEDF